MAKLDFLQSVTAFKTNDTDMGESVGTPVTMAPTEAVSYLVADPRHALVITDVWEDSGVWQPTAGVSVAVFRGASDEPDNFYYQVLPLDKPDADGGDLDAMEAILQAVKTLCDI